MSIGSILAGTPCLGNACIPGVSLPQEAQWAGAVVILALIIAFTIRYSRKWKDEATTGSAPA
jgi:hypothetical protein